MSREIRLEQVLGRCILDGSGQSIGRLEEVVAEWHGDDLVVTRYLIGVQGLLKRLSGEIWRSHGGGLGPSYAARPEQVDISDPGRPRLTCPLADLDRLESASLEGRQPTQPLACRKWRVVYSSGSSVLGNPI